MPRINPTTSAMPIPGNSGDIPVPDTQTIPNPSWAPPAADTGPDADLYAGGIVKPFGQPTRRQPVEPRRVFACAYKSEGPHEIIEMTL